MKKKTNARTLLNDFKTHRDFSDDDILAIRTDESLRVGLINYFKVQLDRPFALTLLNKFIKYRTESKYEISAHDLMLACLLLGMHGQIEDSLKVWEAKRVDFDSFCGVDIQLVPFAGVNTTIAFLQTQTDDESREALIYIIACLNAGDFDNLEQYYNKTPWWV